MKKFLALMLAALMLLGLAACSNGTPTTTPAANETTTPAENTATNATNEDVFKVGVILVGDENEGYTYAHMLGVQDAMKNLGLTDDQVIWKYNVPENEQCQDTAADLVEQGCDLIFSNSYSHQSYMQQVASENPNVTFVAMTGDTAASSGLKNFKNAFTWIFESRYVSGVVAGMKLQELVADGKLSDINYDENGNINIGYVGAYPYAEVVSGYTAFYLGIKSVVENVSMQVVYTNSWFDLTAEAEAANALMAKGCVIIGQHADSTGAPSAVQEALKNGTVAYSVGYNIDMLSVAPDAALTSATNDWAVYYNYAIGAAMKGEEIVTDWAKGYSENAVGITALGNSCAAGTAEKVAEVEAAIKAGTLHVFDTNNFTVGGEHLSTYANVWGFEGNEMIWDGYFHESELRAAPAFDIRIDGIVEK